MSRLILFTQNALENNFSKDKNNAMQHKHNVILSSVIFALTFVVLAYMMKNEGIQRRNPQCLSPNVLPIPEKYTRCI